MTGFLEEVTEASAVPYWGKLAWIKEQMGDEAQDLEAALADPKVSPAAIWKALVSRGFPITERGVNYWCRQARVARG